MPCADPGGTEKMMPCVDCGHVEECVALGAEPFPKDPIPWGWSWAIGGARCERCRECRPKTSNHILCPPCFAKTPAKEKP